MDEGGGVPSKVQFAVGSRSTAAAAAQAPIMMPIDKEGAEQ